MRSALGEAGEGRKMEFQSKMNSGAGDEPLASRLAKGGTNFSFSGTDLPGAGPDLSPSPGEEVPF